MPDAYGLSIPTKLVDLCKPSRTALIVYDMQVGVISQISEGKTSLRNAAGGCAQGRLPSLLHPPPMAAEPPGRRRPISPGHDMAARR